MRLGHPGSNRSRINTIFDHEQWGIIRGSAFALVVAGAVLGVGYLGLPREPFGLTRSMTIGEQIAFALKADLLLFIWLSWCVRNVSSRRFHSSVDRPGPAFSSPSSAVAVHAAVLQNSLEQTVLALGAHLILATVLRGAELILIPLLVLLYLIGRVAFAAGYRRGAPGRSFGMALTAAPTAASYVLAAGLMIAGR